MRLLERELLVPSKLPALSGWLLVSGRERMSESFLERFCRAGSHEALPLLPQGSSLLGPHCPSYSQEAMALRTQPEASLPSHAF